MTPDVYFVYTLHHQVQVREALGGKRTCAEALGSSLTGDRGAVPFSAGAAALTGWAPSMSMGIGEGWLMLFTYVCRCASIASQDRFHTSSSASHQYDAHNMSTFGFIAVND